MNHSLYSADARTHLKIVIVGLACATVVAVIGTFAETSPDPKNYPGARPHMIYAGSLVFAPSSRISNLQDWSQWWMLMKGANWRHPYGPKSNVKHLDDHPVVHITFADALAYAK